MFYDFQIFTGIRKTINWEYLENENNVWRKLKKGQNHLYPNSRNSIIFKTEPIMNM